MAFPSPPADARGVLNSSDPLPVIVEEVTPVWLTKILGRPVKTATLVEPIHGTASKLLYELAYENPDDAATLPTHVCVKGGFNPALIAIHPALNAVYRREAEFFYYIAPAVSMRLPPVWYCGSDTVTGQGIIVLDDLKAKGYTFGDPLEAWPVERVRAGVEELSILHAKTWGAKQKDFPWLKEGLSLREVILSMMVKPEWDKRFLDEAAKPPVPEHLVDRERMIRAFKTLWATTNESLRCVVHGDSHIGNTFITPTGEPGFLDFQGLHSYSALHDVTYFIVGALTVADRRAHEVELFEHYLATLHKAGGPKLEKDAVWEDYRKHHLHGFAWSLTPPMMQPKAQVDIMTERHCAAIVDHKSLELLESLPEYITE
ncbi:kinase-like domain-containing protein [Apodospora peruviana]|uniref:Kinase-like domain-containing protein n=1 Tax=Apodospora peruviana TaxID=516989 RepID=A0AAE0M002_9PEZI|nr:kinase-like domain-containing protein [Apodospora peruviana]